MQDGQKEKNTDPPLGDIHSYDVLNVAFLS